MKPNRLLMTASFFLSLVQNSTQGQWESYRKPIKNWMGAKQYCQGRASHPILAKPMTYQDINQMYNDHMERSYLYWIGLKRGVGQKCFKWQDGSVLKLEKYAPWKPWDTGQPDMKIIPGCVYQINKLWSVTRCWRTLPFICQTDRGTAKPMPSPYSVRWYGGTYSEMAFCEGSAQVQTNFYVNRGFSPDTPTYRCTGCTGISAASHNMVSSGSVWATNRFTCKTNEPLDINITCVVSSSRCEEIESRRRSSVIYPPDEYPVLRINGDPVDDGEQVMLRQGSSYCASCSVQGGKPNETELTLTCAGHDVVTEDNWVETSVPAEVGSQLDGKTCVCQGDHVSECYTKSRARVILFIPQCSYQKYGLNCIKSCPTCTHDCDKFTGECLTGCHPKWKYPKTGDCQNQETEKPEEHVHTHMFDPDPAIIGQPMDVLCNVEIIGGKEMLAGIDEMKKLEKVSLYQSALDGSCEMIAEYEPSADGGHKVKGYVPKSSLIIMDEKPEDTESSITSKILLVIFKAEMEHITEYTCKINYFTVGDSKKTEEVVATQKPAFKNETEVIANVDDVDDSVVVGGNDALGNHTGEVNTTQGVLWRTKAPFHEKSDWQAVMVYGGLLLIASVVLCCCLCCGRRKKNNEDEPTTGGTNGKTKLKHSTSRHNGKSGAKRASSERSELQRLTSLGSSVDLELSTSTDTSDSSSATSSSSE